MSTRLRRCSNKIICCIKPKASSSEEAFFPSLSCLQGAAKVQAHTVLIHGNPLRLLLLCAWSPQRKNRARYRPAFSFCPNSAKIIKARFVRARLSVFASTEPIVPPPRPEDRISLFLFHLRFPQEKACDVGCFLRML